jgi:hypothetical protein
VHNLVKSGEIDIRIVKKNREGAVNFHWEVSYSGKYGPAGQLGYKIDSQLIAKRLDELERPYPAHIRLGSISEICRELGLTDSGNNYNAIKRALKQNAFTGITAKLTYRGADSAVHHLEANFTRYSVVITGDRLPDGSVADAIYIIFQEPYLQVLNRAETRPLDFSYLKGLKPFAQRWYEITSYKIYAALINNYPVARLAYSEFVSLTAQTRFTDGTNMRKQMYKIHKPHLESGYITKVSYQTFTDAEGKLDWWMLYAPGPRAQAEFEQFNQKRGAKKLPGETSAAPEPPPSRSQPPALEQEEQTPAAALALIQLFYRERYRQENYEPPPGSRMLQDAQYLVAKHGLEKAQFIVRFAVGQGRGKPEEAQVKWFQGVLNYEGQALAAYDRQAQQEQRSKEEAGKIIAVQERAEERFRHLTAAEFAERAARANELIELCKLASNPEWEESQRPEIVKAFMLEELVREEKQQPQFGSA